jgi:nucleotide-binding universal stress UspA family protein
MHETYNNILVPVDFTSNTELGVSRAVQLADEGAYIHLLHVINPGTVGRALGMGRFLGFEQNYGERNGLHEQLREWKWIIEDSIKNISVSTWMVYGGTVQGAIEMKAKQVSADLIVIGKTSNHSWFPFLNTVFPGKIVRKTGIPVLAVKPGSMESKIRRVIVPIASERPGNKLDAVLNICKKFRISVHLVTFTKNRSEPTDFSTSNLLQAYQSFKASKCTQVTYDVLVGRNKAEALVQYAEKMEADLLLLHPGSETKVGWINKHISDVLPADSRIQLLIVNPAKGI